VSGGEAIYKSGAALREMATCTSGTAMRLTIFHDYMETIDGAERLVLNLESHF